MEAVATGADQIAVACPFCRVMLSDALTSQRAAGSAPESVEVVDVAQMLLAAVRRAEPPLTPPPPPLACRARIILKNIEAWLSIRRQGVRRC